MRPRVWTWTALVLGVAGAGCTYEYSARGTMHTGAYAYAEPAHVEVATAPPPVRAEVTVRPVQPRPDAFWVAGYWSWQGGAWGWTEGHWETPRAGYVWEPPVVVRWGGGYRFHAGYWRQDNRPPPPVYRAHGRIRVYADADRYDAYVQQPSTRAVYVQQPSAQGSVYVAPPRAQGSVYVQQPQPQPPPARGAVVVQPPAARGSVYVHQPPPPAARAGVVVEPPRARGSVVVQQPPPPRGAVVVRPPAARAGISVQPPAARGGVVVQQPPTRGAIVTPPPAQPPAARAGVIVRTPPRGAVVQPPPPVVRGGVIVRGGVTTTRPGATVQTPPPPAIRPTQPGATIRGGGTVRAGGTVATPPTATQPPPAAPPTTAALSCRSAGNAGPRGGFLVIHGQGFGASPQARIGGNIAPVVDIHSNHIRVQIPNDSGGGMVEVIAGGQTATCGSIRIVGGGAPR